MMETATAKCRLLFSSRQSIYILYMSAWRRVLHLKGSTQTTRLHPKNTQRTSARHLTKTLNYLPSTSDVDRKRSAVPEKLRQREHKGGFNSRGR